VLGSISGFVFVLRELVDYNESADIPLPSVNVTLLETLLDGLRVEIASMLAANNAFSEFNDLPSGS
jgi:hypothetical protein